MKRVDLIRAIETQGARRRPCVRSANLPKRQEKAHDCKVAEGCQSTR